MRRQSPQYWFPLGFPSIVAVLLLGAWGAPAGAAEVPTELVAVIEQARAERLPVDALILKAQEGVAKGVPTARIAAVLAEEVSSMAEARHAAPALPDAALPAAGRAVRAGASAETVRGLAELPEPARSYAAVADLLNAGLPERDAAKLVRIAATGPGPESALHGIATAVSAMLRNGRTPEAVVDRLQAIVAQGGSPLSVLPDLPSQVPEHAAAWDNRAKGKGATGATTGVEGTGKGKGGTD